MEDNPVHVTIWNDAGPHAHRAVLVHGTMTWGDECYERQRPLAAEFELDVVDRRGFGDSPDTERSDWEIDAEDILKLLGPGAHLVGHSYGGVAAMAAAASKPEAVHSLVLIEPAALRVAEEIPTVGRTLGRYRRAFGSASSPQDMSAEDYLRSATRFGMPVPEFTPRRLRATRTAMAERPCWEAVIDLAPLAAAPWPKAVINGTWTTAHPEYRRASGEALMACGEYIAEQIGAELVRVPDADHMPHRDQPELVNACLRNIWTRLTSRVTQSRIYCDCGVVQADPKNTAFSGQAPAAGGGLCRRLWF